MIPVTLTRKSAMQIGVSDALYALYCDIGDIYDNCIETNGFVNSTDAFWSEKADKLCRPAVKKALDAFLREYTWLFTDSYEWLHPNSAGVLRFSMLDSRNRGRHSIIQPVSFSEFLADLQLAMARTITSKRHLANSFYFAEADAKDVSRHVQNLAKLGAERVQSISDAYADTPPTGELITYRNLSAITCNQQGHSVIQRRAVIKSKNGEKVTMPAHYCLDCGRFFVGIETWRIYKHEYHPVGVIARDEADFTCGVNFRDFGSSELYQHGYNVRSGGMSSAERHTLMESLVDSSTMSVFAIVRDLHRNIRAFKDIYRYEDAVHKWESDMKYILEYEPESA